MAYSTSSPPQLISQSVGGLMGASPTGLRLWVHKNTDAVATVRASGYYSNGYSLGMRKGDLLLYIKTDASPISMQMMIVAAASISGSTETVDLSDGTAITATNSD